jgi:hypothetical protein
MSVIKYVDNKISDSLFDIPEPTEEIPRQHVLELAQRILDRSGHKNLLLDLKSKLLFDPLAKI